MNSCLGCDNGTPSDGARICPACGKVFQGNGWDGVDAHWKAKHEGIRPYREFFDNLCAKHARATPN